MKSRVKCSVAVLLGLVFAPAATKSSDAPASVCTDYPAVEVVFVGTLTSFTESPTLSPMRFESLEPCG